MGRQRLPARTRGQLAASLSAVLRAQQQAPDDPRLGSVPALRSSTFVLGAVVFSEERYLRRQRLHLSFNQQRPWLLLLVEGALAIDLDDGDTPLILKSGRSPLLLTPAQDQHCTVFSAPTHWIRLGLDPACRWTRDGLIPSECLPLLQPMLQLLRDSHRLDSSSETTDRLSIAIQRYVLEALEPLGVALSAAASDPLQVLLDWLPNHLDQDLRVADLAAVACVSSRRLQELCQSRFSCTPMDLLRQHRLDALHQDLSHSKGRDRGISQLLKRWHLPDSSATRSAFETRFGHSPSELRRRFLLGQG